MTLTHPEPKPKRKQYKPTGEAVSCSHTEATNEARREFASLKATLDSVPYLDYRDKIDAEIARLVEVLTESLHSRDGMVHDETHAAQQAHYRSEIEELEKTAREQDDEIDKLRAQIRALEQAAQASGDGLRVQIAELLSDKQAHDDEIAKYRDRAKFADTMCAAMSKRADEDRQARIAAETRMASWSSDKTAAQTADHYRERYEQQLRHNEELHRQIEKAFDDGILNASSKVRRDAIVSVRNAFRSKS